MEIHKLLGHTWIGKIKKEQKKRFSLLKTLWNDRDILIVEGDKTRLGVGNDLFDNTKSIIRIEYLSKNAFSSYFKILETVKRYIESRLVLIALGPTATVLAYDLAVIGVQALDIGHIDIEYEWYLSKATEKAVVKGKQVQEIHNNNFIDCYDYEYEQQIVDRIL